MCFPIFAKFHQKTDEIDMILLAATVSYVIFKSGWLTFRTLFAIIASTKPQKGTSLMNDTLGQRITRLRTEHGMSQGDLADALGIS